MYYVFVPFHDDGMDSFADALAPDLEGPGGRYQRIDTDNGSLAGLTWKDRLYVLIHGSKSGVGGYKQMVAGAVDDQGLQAFEQQTIRVPAIKLAKHLIDRGLPDARINVRLWCCWSAHDSGGAYLSYGAKLRDELRRQGRSRASVTAYKLPVRIDTTLADSHKQVIVGNQARRVRPTDRVRYFGSIL